jgi:hypothetical protein
VSGKEARADAERPSHARVEIHYRRIPDRDRIYDQRVVVEREDVIITLSEPIDLPEPMVHDGVAMLESGSLALWFTFPGAWHDIGRFHAADGRFTGIYANILTPPRMEGPVWHTTDLFLDVWWPDGGSPIVLDGDELQAALEGGLVDHETAASAWAEATRVMERARRGTWPPPVVAEWPLERALAVLDLY